MSSKYLWLSLLLMIVYFLYSHEEIKCYFTEKIKYYLTERPFNIIDAIYFGFNENSDGSRIFTTTELKRYTNLENGLYLSLLGQVFDVTKGEKHYGPEKNYHAFTGRDASLAFITGVFDDQNLTDDISTLSPSQVKALDDWLKFYNINYMYKGKLYGRFYNRDGSPTAEFYKVQEKVLLVKKEKELEEKQDKMFPPCNVEWNRDTGTVFWCTERSGGIARDWIGVPRILFETSGAQGSSRCVCTNLDSEEYQENKARFKEYDGCEKYATKCVSRLNKT